MSVHEAWLWLVLLALAVFIAVFVGISPVDDGPSQNSRDADVKIHTRV
jgi:hypothetical protein